MNLVQQFDKYMFFKLLLEWSHTEPLHLNAVIF